MRRVFGEHTGSSTMYRRPNLILFYVSTHPFLFTFQALGWNPKEFHQRTYEWLGNTRKRFLKASRKTPKIAAPAEELQVADNGDDKSWAREGVLFTLKDGNGKEVDLGSTYSRPITT